MNWINDLLTHLTKIFQWWVMINPWEQAIRVRFGKITKLLNTGIHFKIPFFDSVYVQTTRLRVVNLPLQTLSTNDEKTITITLAMGYSIENIEVLFQTLYHPESTMANICTGEIAEYVSTHDLSECRPAILEACVLNKIKSLPDYGLKIEYFKVVGFANVKTYRLINDMYTSMNSIDMDFKK